MDPVLVFALIGLLGIGSQWLAWRFQLPAIVLMLAAGLIAGPALGILDPKATFGDLFKPIVAVAVAVILFEGGLTLNFRSLRDAGPAVMRLVVVGAPLGWIASTLAVHFGAGLSWETSLVFGGIMIVTGPTVIAPLLRQARLAARPASILKWESIVNDPIGALAAVLAYELIVALNTTTTFAQAAWHFGSGLAVASVLGYVGGAAIAWAFARGKVPEYMKVPVLFGSVLLIYAASDYVLHESGLLAVTVMGIYLANAHLPSLTEIRRFKEHATVILVSGVFVLLAASLTMADFANLSWRTVFFVLSVVLLARPLTVFIALIGTGLPFREKLMVAWIGPRGIVLVAVSGLFGTQLAELGIEDGQGLTAISFALVAGTVILHGFSMAPLAKLLGLTSANTPGLLIVGGSRWATNLAAVLEKAEVPVLIADRNWFRLRTARSSGIDVFHGEILSEVAEHTLDLNKFGLILAATDNDAYNALIGTDLGPEFGRNQVFQVGRHDEMEGKTALPVTLGGRPFGPGTSYSDLSEAVTQGASFRLTRLTEAYDLSDYRAQHPDAIIFGHLGDGGLTLLGDAVPDTLPEGTRLLVLSHKSDRGEGAAESVA
ncbi:cation:proton antiporter [Pontivivens insulae]|uniref:K(+)/H(+) antiporter NhaP n=1 Tax=Pontivivens insulae TaxID=1639689 RepID=A0A2R8ACH5_9RHOB|nr:sodium:proton antiporter [Pontivivens insulae]RED13808.1 sodium/proton antiporter (CPA1 family) [Pontivivens insulae]SPF29882.1 K(+)/H(+) antiporter NhaP [Pontivivens insulae]